MFELEKNIKSQFSEIFVLNQAYSENIYNVLLKEFSDIPRDLVIEAFVFFYSLCDYYASVNGVKLKHRQKLYRSYGRKLIFSKALKGKLMTRSTVDDYMDYRIEIYSRIFNDNFNIPQAFFEAIADFQTELFLSIINDGKMSLYDPYDHINEGRQKVERRLSVQDQVRTLLIGYYTQIMPALGAKLKAGIKPELFSGKAYRVFSGQ